MTITIGPTEEWFAKNGIIITNNLIAYYDARQTASYPGSGTTIYDLSGLNNNATMYNGLSYSTDFVFDGTNDHFFTPDLAGSFGASRDQTLEAWIYPTVSTGTVFSETNNPTSYGWYDSQIELVSGEVRGQVWQLWPSYVVGGNITVNNWYHVVLTYKNSTNQLIAYLNSVQGSSATISRQNPIDNAGGVIYFGVGLNTGTNLGGNQFFTGKISQVRIYSSALTNTEILNNFNATKKYFI